MDIEQTKTEQPTDLKNLRATISPKHNCPKCYGTGRIGFIDGDVNNPLVCQCVVKIYRKAQANKSLSESSKTEDASKAEDKPEPLT